MAGGDAYDPAVDGKACGYWVCWWLAVFLGNRAGGVVGIRQLLLKVCGFYF